MNERVPLCRVGPGELRGNSSEDSVYWRPARPRPGSNETTAEERYLSEHRPFKQVAFSLSLIESNEYIGIVCVIGGKIFREELCLLMINYLERVCHVKRELFRLCHIFEEVTVNKMSSASHLHNINSG